MSSTHPKVSESGPGEQSSDVDVTDAPGGAPTGSPKRRRLSVLRILVALAVIAAASAGGTRVAREVIQKADRSTSQWSAPYVDVTLPPFLDFQDPVANPNADVVLAFIVSSPNDQCAPSWGGSYGLDAAGSQLDLDRRIARLRERGGDVLVSFGGVANDELARSCTDPAALAAAYRSVVTRYALNAIDLDLEGAGLDDPAALSRRAVAVAQLQAAARAAGRHLAVWLTLPVAPDGLQPDAIAAVDGMLDAHVDLAGVNVMTMDYGSARPATTDIVTASMSAVDASARQLTASYLRIGVKLAQSAAYAKLGVTPMIGQNDSPADRLDTGGAQRLFDQASSRGVNRFSMWSLNRDAKCGGNTDPAIADNFCSGVDQKPLQFSAIFRASRGRPTPTAPAPVVPVLAGRAPVATGSVSGPYAQWRQRREYDIGAKVVWNGKVYESKWWNKSAQPDAPVKNDWDSPWRVIGPILPQDATASTTTTLANGTYLEWSLYSIYHPGDRVQHLGVGYRAKWWTRGDDPAADVDNTWQSPWAPVPGPPSAIPTPITGPVRTTTTVTTTTAVTTTTVKRARG